MKTAYASVRLLLVVLNLFYLSVASAGQGAKEDVWRDTCPGGYIKNGECIGGITDRSRQCGDEKSVLDQMGCLNADGSTNSHCIVLHGKQDCPKDVVSAIACKGFAICTDFPKATENLPATGLKLDAENAVVN